MKIVITDDANWGPVRYHLEMWDGPDGIYEYCGIIKDLDEISEMVKHFNKLTCDSLLGK